MPLSNPKFILGIDPANKESAFCLVDASELKPLAFAKLSNDLFIQAVMDTVNSFGPIATFSTQVVIENMESFGMPVGRSVLDTCIFIGELKKFFEMCDMDVVLIYRHEEKITICHSSKANDATIKQALVDRFAPNTSNHGKGTKKNPGFFYGFKADCWSAFAIAVTYHDAYLVDDIHLDELPF